MPKSTGINKRSVLPATVLMSAEQRVEFLANVIVDRILEDQRNGHRLLKDILQG